MMLFRNFILAAIALTVAVSSESKIPLESCEDEDFETTYFNFFIDIDNIGGECNFEAMGTTVQNIINETQQKIPEYQDEFIDATVCLLPKKVADSVRSLRFLRRQTRWGRYSYYGGGICMKCTQNRRIQCGGRNLEAHEQFESFLKLHNGDEQAQLDKNRDRELHHKEEGNEKLLTTEVICNMMEPAAVDVAVAKRAVAVSESVLQEMKDLMKTSKYVKKESATKHIAEAEEVLEDCKYRMETAKAKAVFVGSACKEATSSGLEEEPTADLEEEPTADLEEEPTTSDLEEEELEETSDYKKVFKETAEDLKEECTKEAGIAQVDYYKVKGQKIRLKTEIIKSEFTTRQVQMEADEKKLEARLEKNEDWVKNNIKKIDERIKIAQKRSQADKEEELMAEKEALTLEEQALGIEFEATKCETEEKLKNDYEFAMGALGVEAANSVKSYLKEFADLLEQVLQDCLYGKYSECFEKYPKVLTRVELLKNKEKQLAPDDCPTDVE